MSLSKKQKDVFEFILTYTRDQGVVPTQKEIRDHFNLKSFGSVQRYLKYLSEAGYIEQDWNAKRGLKILKNRVEASVPPSETIELPLLGKVAAGSPIEAIEDHREKIMLPINLIPSHLLSSELFALTVVGNSMIEEGIFEEDIIICRRQKTARNGETVVALIDGDATVKKFFHFSDRVELHPANSQLKPFIYSKSQARDLQLAGVLVALFRRY